jgi:phenylalanyl-tRNA synthetase beta chain
MHAYDADKISGDISIRYAKQNESFKALDGIEYKLTSENIVVSDSKNIISLAGIIGSQDSAVTRKTKNIIIESAFFNPKLLANKARKLKLQTESSHRFERGVDFELPNKALNRLIDIIYEIKICEFSDINIIEDVTLLPGSSEVELNFEKIRSQIGINIQDTEIIELLLSIGCKYNKKNNSVMNPSYRYDLSIHADYVEEVARLYGYDNIPVSSEKLNISLLR